MNKEKVLSEREELDAEEKNFLELFRSLQDGKPGNISGMCLYSRRSQLKLYFQMPDALYNMAERCRGVADHIFRNMMIEQDIRQAQSKKSKIVIPN